MRLNGPETRNRKRRPLDLGGNVLYATCLLAAVPLLVLERLAPRVYLRLTREVYTETARRYGQPRLRRDVALRGRRGIAPLLVVVLLVALPGGIAILALLAYLALGGTLPSWVP